MKTKRNKLSYKIPEKKINLKFYKSISGQYYYSAYLKLKNDKNKILFSFNLSIPIGCLYDYILEHNSEYTKIYRVNLIIKNNSMYIQHHKDKNKLFLIKKEHIKIQIKLNTKIYCEYLSNYKLNRNFNTFPLPDNFKLLSWNEELKSEIFIYDFNSIIKTIFS